MGKKKNTRNALTYETLPALFTGICDAIRTKTGGTDPINHQDIPNEIGLIPTGSTFENRTNAVGAGNQSASPYTITATQDGLLIIAVTGNRTDKIGAITINDESVTALNTGVMTATNTYQCIAAVYVKANDVIKVSINQTNYSYNIAWTILY